MGADDPVGIAERSPEAVLDFWLGRLRAPADASRENWQQAMRRWRVGPFARSTLAPNDLRVQREWCEQMHREGVERFFADPVWDTPRGILAKLIVLDQFPRSVYRGTALAYANDPVTASISRQACETDWELAHYNVIERIWMYFPLGHVEDLKLQELCVEKTARMSADLIAAAPPDRRRVNQVVGWSFVKAAIEHAETLLLFGRFPHRNAALLRPHRGGERRYLTNPARPLWSFSQPLNPGYFAVLGALHRTEDGFEEDRITRTALAGLLRAAGLSPEDPASPMDIFDFAGDDVPSYRMLWRHLCLPEHAQTLERLQQLPLVADLRKAVRSHVVKAGDRSWPPRSTTPAIDVAALSALVRADGPSDARRTGVRTEGDRDGPSTVASGPDRSPEAAPSLSLVVRNGRGELERVAEALDGFADRHGLPQQDRFQLQLCLEETLMYIVERGHDDSDTQRIEVHLQVDEESRSLAIRFVDDGRELDPDSLMFQPGPDTIQEETVVDGLGLHLVRTYVDDLRYRREDGRNYLSLSKRIGI